jgi:hypothetical protein
MISDSTSTPPTATLSPSYRRALDEARSLEALVAPYAGQWVALSLDWRRVIAADPQHAACVRKARAHVRPGEVPALYRIGAPGRSG